MPSSTPATPNPDTYGGSLGHLDLNLLVALDALLQERSVTRAAERLQRSQPALSASLKRLRHQFQDELLIRVGNNHQLTPLATQLKERLSLLLADTERLFEARSHFDPLQSTRDFVVGGSDYGEFMLGRAIAAELAEHAPNTRLRFTQMSDEMLLNPHDSIRNTDGFIFPRLLFEGLPRIDAYVDRWVLIVDAHNSVVGDRVTLDELGELSWITAFHREGPWIPPIRQLKLLGVDTKVAVSTEGFASLPFLLLGTDRIATIQLGLANQLATDDRFRLIEFPFDAVPLQECFWWHPTLTHDPGHTWFRSIVERAGATLSAELGTPPPAPRGS